MKYTVYYEGEYSYIGFGIVETEADNLYDLIRKLERGDVTDEEKDVAVYEDMVTQIDVNKEYYGF